MVPLHIRELKKCRADAITIAKREFTTEGVLKDAHDIKEKLICICNYILISENILPV